MELIYHQLTSPGDRENNQDYMAYRVEQDYAVFVVADGLGGHSAGEKASRFFCRGLIAKADDYVGLIEYSPTASMLAWINSAIAEMWAQFEGDPAAQLAHTTIAILYIDKNQVITAHCGDSRVYRMNPKGVVWRTRDHSLLQRLLEQGKLSEHEMGAHPEQNRLYRSINATLEHESEINVYAAPEPGETFLLCSDGFWENVKQQELQQLAQPESGSMELAKFAKLSMFRANGKSDNITVQWVRFVSA